MAIETDQQAPDFTLPGMDGDITLSNELARHHVVLAFYAKDSTSG